MPIDVVSYSLVGLGSLIEIRNVAELELKQEQPSIVVVMDTSGSMADLVGIVLSDCIPSALKRAGYDLSTTRVTVITFSDKSDRLLVNGQNPTGHDLQNLYRIGNGQTNMSGVFDLLEIQLRNFKHVVLFGISDGEICDVRETLEYAQRVSHDYPTHVEVTMVRLITSWHSTPDTRALACLGQLGTNGIHSIHDIHAQSTSNDAPWRQELINLLHSQLQSSTIIDISHKDIRRTPSDYPCRRLFLQRERVDNNRLPIFMATSKTDRICVNGTEFPVRESDELSTQGMQFFCEYAVSKLQLCNLLGFKIDALKMWFSKFFAIAENGNGQIVADMRQRVLRVKRSMSAAVRNAINEVLQQANQDRLRSLNQTQQQAADYLRQSASSALAKRNAKNTIQQQQRGDTDTIVQQAKNIIREFTSLVETNENPETSFFSIYTSHEAIACILENQVELDALSDMDILRLFGLLGVCYHHTPNDFVDPYIFRIHQLLPGHYLNLSDLRESNSQKLNGVTAELRAPGTQVTITGVLPLRHFNPELFDLFFTRGMKILEAHSSLNMRRMLAPVRSDMLGERIGVLIHIVMQSHKLSEWDMLVLKDITTQLKMLLAVSPHKQEFELLAEMITQQHNFRNLLTGSNAISCFQKPLIALLCYLSPDHIEYGSDMLQVLFEFDAYHRARHHFQDSDQRSSIIRQLLGIDLSNVLLWFPLANIDYVPDESDGVYRNVLIQTAVNTMLQENKSWTVDEDSVIKQQPNLMFDWMPNPILFCKLLSVFNQARPNNEERQVDDMKLSSRRIFLSTVSAVYAREEKDRIVNGENQMFEWNNAMSESKFIQTIAHDMYASYLESQVSLEMDRRDNIELANVIYQMAQPTMDDDEFEMQLKLQIPNREHKGYNLLMQALMERANDEDTSFWTQKLAILISGRNAEDVVCFSQGNFDSQFFKYEKYFLKTEWERLMNLKTHYGRWQYRASNIPNHSGHCNSNPSDWAVNIYPTLRNKK